MRTHALLLAAAAALAGCGETAKKASAQPPASNTGFFAIVASGSKHKLYMPAQSSPTTSRSRLVVVDAAAPHGTSGLLGFIDLGADGAAQAVGGNGLDIVAVDASWPNVYFIDAATDTLRHTSVLSGTEPIAFSDNSSYSMGAAVDARRRKAWVSISSGLIEFDLDTFATTATIPVPVPENFAYDPASGRIYAPYYVCDPVLSAENGFCVLPYVQVGGPPQTDSLTIIETTPAPPQAYTLVDPAAADPRAPLGFEPDAVAVDFALGVAVLAVEAPAAIQVLDVSAVSLDSTAMTCSVPAVVPTVIMPGVHFTEVAVDSVTHLAIVAQEQADGVVFLDLAAAKRGITTTLVENMPTLPSGFPWVTRADPHGAGTGIINGKPYAFLVSDQRDWVARIDLRGVAGVMAGTGTFADQVAYISVPAPP